MTALSGPDAWAVLRLRNEASLLRDHRRQVEDYGYLPHQLAALSDAAAATDRMAASVQAGDRKALRANWQEFDKFVGFAGSAAPHLPHDWKPGTTPVDQIAARWELDEDEAAGETEDLQRSRGTQHRVRGFKREVEGHPERVRPHLAKNPRRRP
ncbi:MAG: hypothetical protein ACYDDZ_06655 [Acidimicrobiales bacterium]